MKFNRLAIVIGALLLVTAFSSAVLAVPTGCRETGVWNYFPSYVVQPTAGQTDVIAAVFEINDGGIADPSPAPYANCAPPGPDGFPTYLTRVHLYAPGATGVSTVKIYIDVNADGAINVGDQLWASASAATLATTGVDITTAPMLPIGLFLPNPLYMIIALDFVGTPTIPFNIQATFYSDDQPAIPGFTTSSQFATAPAPAVCAACANPAAQQPTNPMTSNITVAPGAGGGTGPGQFKGQNNGSGAFESSIVPVVIQNAPATRGGDTTVTAGAIEAFMGHFAFAEGGYCGGPGTPQLFATLLPGGFAIAGWPGVLPYVPTLNPFGTDVNPTAIHQVRVRFSGPVAPYVTAASLWVEPVGNDGTLFSGDEVAVLTATPINNIATFGSLVPGYAITGAPIADGAGCDLWTLLVNIGPGAPTGTLTAEVVLDVGDDITTGATSNMISSNPITIGTINVTGTTPPPPPPSVTSKLNVTAKTTSLKCTSVGKKKTLKFTATNTGTTDITVLTATENSPNFHIYKAFSSKTVKAGKSKTLSVKVQCDAVGTFSPPYGVSFTTNETGSPTVGPASAGSLATLSTDVRLSKSSAIFNVQGAQLAQVQVFGLNGKMVYDSGMVASNALTWDLLNAAGQRVPNGVYLYVVTMQMPDGRLVKSEVRKLIVKN